MSSSRKRSSETPLVSAGKADMEIVEEGQDGTPHTMAVKPRSRLRVRIRRYHGVAKWTWNVGRGDEDEEEVCGICQSAFEGTPPGVKYPGDEAPVVFGVCGHAFHLQCVATWLNSSRQTCPICRADWEYGNSDQSNNRSGGGVGNNQRS
jgi:anaphase-promoting complex subunit 11